MAYKNKTYIAFDGDTDLHYYNLLKAWKAHKDFDFDFYDAHDVNSARDSSLTESIKAQLRERFDSSKMFMLLVGEKTKFNRKFIPWEIEQAQKRGLPIVVVNINGSRKVDNDRCPVPLRDALAIHIPFNAKIMQYAFDHWPSLHETYKSQGKAMPYTYTDQVYKNLGL